MAHEQIQPVAFHLIKAGLDLPLFSMRFPDEWRGPLNYLAAVASGRVGSNRPTSFRIASLNAAIAAFTPQLFVTPGQAYRSTDPWLIATEEIRPDKIGKIVRAWLAEHYATREELAEAYDAAYQALRDEDLVWESFQLTLNNAPLPNNTAQVQGLAYAILPAYLANTLVQRRINIPILQETRQLVRVPTLDTRAEVMTWPPVEYTEDETNRQAAYSYFINISLQTLVGCPNPRIHMTYGVRRWRIPPLRTSEALYLSSSEGRTVYLRHPQALSGVPSSSHFTRAAMEAKYVSESHRIPIWRDALTGIAGRIGASLPNTEELTLTPNKYLFAQDDAIIAAIVEKTPRNHPIGTGMGLEVREEITRVIAEKLQDTLKLTPSLERSDITRTAQSNPLIVSDLRELPVETRLQAISDSINKYMTIEVWFQTDAARDQLIWSIHAMLTGTQPDLVEPDVNTPENTTQAIQTGLFDEYTPPAPVTNPKKLKRKRAAPERPNINTREEHTLSLPDGGEIHIIPRSLGTLGLLGAPLPEPTEADMRSKGEYKRRETQKRAEQLVTALPTTGNIPTLALIELPNFQDPRDRQRRRQIGLRDPKRALRLGMAATGRVTKFTTGKFNPDQQTDKPNRSRMTPEELLRERCDNAILEGLRQMGYLPGKITIDTPSGYHLPERMTVVGIRMLRLTRKRTETKVYLPVATVFDTATSGVYAWLPDDQVGVRPFHQAMIDITYFRNKDVSRFRQEEMLARLEQFLTVELPKHFSSNIAIIVEAQNMRWLWPGLQNGELEQDVIKFRKGGDGVPLKDMQHRFRLIRLRTYDRAETPMWYTPGANPGRDYASGLFRDSEAARTFYNIATKPKTQGQARRGKQDDPSEQYAIPSMLEILVAAQQNDDSDEAWALAVHTWRRMSYLTGGDMTLLPIPLQWAEKMDRYAAVIGPWVFRERYQEYLWEDDDMNEEDNGDYEQLQLFGEEDDEE